MKKWFWMAGALMLVAAPLHAYVSVGSMVNRPVKRPANTAPVIASDPGSPLGRHEIKATTCEPGQPLPEPGTMAITAMGLLAAAAMRRKSVR